jgi:hypothetical protein
VFKLVSDFSEDVCVYLHALSRAASVPAVPPG